MKPHVYGARIEVDAKIAMAFEDRLKALSDMVAPAHAALPTFG